MSTDIKVLATWTFRGKKSLAKWICILLSPRIQTLKSSKVSLHRCKRSPFCTRNVACKTWINPWCVKLGKPLPLNTMCQVRFPVQCLHHLIHLLPLPNPNRRDGPSQVAHFALQLYACQTNHWHCAIPIAMVILRGNVLLGRSHRATSTSGRIWRKSFHQRFDDQGPRRCCQCWREWILFFVDSFGEPESVQWNGQFVCIIAARDTIDWWQKNAHDQAEIGGTSRRGSLFPVSPVQRPI